MRLTQRLPLRALQSTVPCISCMSSFAIFQLVSRSLGFGVQWQMDGIFQYNFISFERQYLVSNTIIFILFFPPNYFNLASRILFKLCIAKYYITLLVSEKTQPKSTVTVCKESCNTVSLCLYARLRNKFL